MTHQLKLVELAEIELFDSIVHGLRSKGWTRMDAEGEALDRIEKRRLRAMEERMLQSGGD